MAIVKVAGVKSASGTSTTYTTASVDTSGSTLIVINVGGYSGSSPWTITDSKSNVYTELTAQTDGSSGRVQLFYCAAPTVGTGHTFTITGGGSLYGGIDVLTFSGTATSSVLDAQSGATGNSTSAAAGSLTPASDGSVFVAGGGGWADGMAASAISDGTLEHNTAGVNGAIYGHSMAQFIQSTAAAKNMTFTISGSTTWGAVVAVFKAESGGTAASFALRRAFPRSVLMF